MPERTLKILSISLYAGIITAMVLEKNIVIIIVRDEKNVKPLVRGLRRSHRFMAFVCRRGVSPESAILLLQCVHIL
jgi:hypothetical protein